ncbi:Mannan-binding lectin serine protease 1, partial [Ophiophagus hannah]
MLVGRGRIPPHTLFSSPKTKPHHLVFSQNSLVSQPAMLAGEFWELKSTYLKLEKASSKCWFSLLSQSVGNPNFPEARWAGSSGDDMPREEFPHGSPCSKRMDGPSAEGLGLLPVLPGFGRTEHSLHSWFLIFFEGRAITLQPYSRVARAAAAAAALSYEQPYLALLSRPHLLQANHNRPVRQTGKSHLWDSTSFPTGLVIAHFACAHTPLMCSVQLSKHQLRLCNTFFFFPLSADCRRLLFSLPHFTTAPEVVFCYFPGNRWVVTAAHCLHEELDPENPVFRNTDVISPSSFTVILGKRSLRNKPGLQLRQSLTSGPRSYDRLGLLSTALKEVTGNWFSQLWPSQPPFHGTEESHLQAKPVLAVMTISR